MSVHTQTRTKIKGGDEDGDVEEGQGEGSAFFQTLVADDGIEDEPSSGIIEIEEGGSVRCSRFTPIQTWMSQKDGDAADQQADEADGCDPVRNADGYRVTRGLCHKRMARE